MTSTEIIDGVTAALLIVFNSGMFVRIAKIYADGQDDEEQNTSKMVKTHVKAMIIINLISAMILTIKKFYE